MNGLEVGSMVLYTTPSGVDLAALVTHIWSPTCINLAFVSPDEKATDDDGRKIERLRGIMHTNIVGGTGGYWRRPDEARAGD